MRRHLYGHERLRFRSRINDVAPDSESTPLTLATFILMQVLAASSRSPLRGCGDTANGISAFASTADSPEVNKR